MKLLIIGAAIIDKMMWVDALPKSGDDILCEKTKDVVGGCAFNVASTLRNLHVPHDLCVPIGSGPHAEIIEHALIDKGYPILIKEQSQDNGYCITLIEASGERTFITVQGAECSFQSDWFKDIDLSSYDMIYIVGYQAVGDSGKVIADWLCNSMSPSATLFFAPGPVITEIDSDVMSQIFSLKPILHLNDKELLEYTKKDALSEALSYLSKCTRNTIIATLGKKGAAIYRNDNLTVIPTAPVSVVDTVGAGDSHIAAIMGFLSQGDSMEKAVEKANKVSGILVHVSGPTVDEETFLQFMKE